MNNCTFIILYAIIRLIDSERELNMLSSNTNKILWVGVAVGVILSIGFAALNFFPNILNGTKSTMHSSIRRMNDGTSESKLSQSRIVDSGTLNFDMARHPATEKQLESIISGISDHGFTQLSLRFGDNEHLLYKSEYLQNDDEAALSDSDIQKLVKFANSKGVSIVPEIDSPSHAGAILKALQKSHPDVYSDVKMDSDTIDYTKDASVKLMETLYSELMDDFDNQSTKAFVIGADEVPGSDTTYELLTTYLNSLNSYLNKNGYNGIIWNDSILKSEVPKLSKNLTIYYWSQSGNKGNLSELANTRASVSDFTSAGFSVVNGNAYANTYNMINIGNENDESYFLDYLKNTTNSKRFDEIVDNENQWWTNEPSVKSNGMLISIWGNNSDNIDTNDVIKFISKIELPDK